MGKLKKYTYVCLKGRDALEKPCPGDKPSRREWLANWMRPEDFKTVVCYENSRKCLKSTCIARMRGECFEHWEYKQFKIKYIFIIKSAQHFLFSRMQFQQTWEIWTRRHCLNIYYRIILYIIIFILSLDSTRRTVFLAFNNWSRPCRKEYVLSFWNCILIWRAT